MNHVKITGLVRQALTGGMMKILVLCEVPAKVMGCPSPFISDSASGLPETWLIHPQQALGGTQESQHVLTRAVI